MGFDSATLGRATAHLRQKMEQEALRSSDRVARSALQIFRQRASSAGLGNLGNAVSYGSDLKSGQGLHRRGGDSSSASGWLYVRSGSERTRGALAAYTDKQTVIRPHNRSGLLWFPTEAIQRIVGRGKDRERLTPALWKKHGLDQKIGPLVKLFSGGTAVLVVQNVGVRATGRIRSLTKRGAPRKGDTHADQVIAFVGIPNTVRTQRVNIEQIVREVISRETRTLTVKGS